LAYLQKITNNIFQMIESNELANSLISQIFITY